MRLLFPFLFFLSAAPVGATHMDILKEEDARAVDSKILNARVK